MGKVGIFSFYYWQNFTKWMMNRSMRVNNVCYWKCVCSVAQLYVTPDTAALQSPLSMEFSRQEYWSRLPFPPPEDLPIPGIKPMSLVSPVLVGRFFTTVPPGKPTSSKKHDKFKHSLQNTCQRIICRITMAF